MSQRIKRHLSILGACAGLSLVGCAQVDDEPVDDTELLAQTGDGRTLYHDGGDPHHHDDEGEAHDHDAGMAHGHDAGMAHDAGAGHDDHAGHGGDGGAMPEAMCTAQFPAYRPGLSIKAGDLTVQLVSAVPVPPRQVVPNDWVIKVLDASGAPLTGATLTDADSYMRIHNHFGAAPPKVVVLPEPGQWKLDNLDFSMRGPWEVLFDVRPAGATRATQVSFPICVE